MRLADRWFESFSIPGYEAYEANQGALEAFGSGEQPPLVASSSQTRRRDEGAGTRPAIERTARRSVPGSRTSSFFTTGNDAYVSSDRRTTFAEIYPPGKQQFRLGASSTRLARRSEGGAAGVSAHLTGRDPLFEDVGGTRARACSWRCDRRPSARS